MAVAEGAEIETTKQMGQFGQTDGRVIDDPGFE
jgi:hypothetical protein